MKYLNEGQPNYNGHRKPYHFSGRSFKAEGNSPKPNQRPNTVRNKRNNNHTDGQKPRLFAIPIQQLIKRVKSEPPQKMVYSGIKENTVGFVFGPAKSGKTTLCECLGINIAAGLHSFLGLPINIENRKVLFISFEEFYTGRTERNMKQISALTQEQQDIVNENYIVVNEEMPRYIHTDEDWQVVDDIITTVKPGIIFMDSLSRLYEGVIEDSKIAKGVMKKLKELSFKHNAPIVVIHHTPKLYNSPLTINAIAGSRIIAQEADFMIGLNKTLDGKRYIKDVAFRYAPENDETVKLFDIDSNLWVNSQGEAKEVDLLAAYDGRINDVNKEKLFDFISEKGEVNNGIVSFSEIEEKFISTDAMSRQTAFSQLNKLVQEGRITKPDRGQYKCIV